MTITGLSILTAVTRTRCAVAFLGWRWLHLMSACRGKCWMVIAEDEWLWVSQSEGSVHRRVSRYLRHRWKAFPEAIPRASITSELARLSDKLWAGLRHPTELDWPGHHVFNVLGYSPLLMNIGESAIEAADGIPGE
ncbi:hypothetical protein BKA56DRAFT_269462 [Ilyonectria sp. MPI-CAGE-AT-0026]|nr:hypothetical protein BKA56DRAFT_269462 [Ilyonectria sp. MPI-CAGE-AT-0026]